MRSRHFPGDAFLGLVHEAADESENLVQPFLLLARRAHVQHIDMVGVQHRWHSDHGGIQTGELLVNVQLRGLDGNR